MLKPKIITEEDEKDGKTKKLIKMHMRNSVSGPLQKKKQAKKKGTNKRKAFKAHKHMTCGSKVIWLGLRKNGRDDLNYRLMDSFCSHFRAREM